MEKPETKPKNWDAMYEGHKIRVIVKPNGSAELRIDGELVDSTDDLDSSGKEANLTGPIGDEDMVYAYSKPNTVSIEVNEKKIPAFRR